MKLTREQVSKLTDTELNRAMFWLYPPKYESVDDTGGGIYCIGIKGGYGYLADYNLTMPLMVEKGILLAPMNISIYPKFWTAQDNKAIRTYSHNQNPLRVICEVLLMIAMERES